MILLSSVHPMTTILLKCRLSQVQTSKEKEEPETDMNESATSVTSSATEFHSVPEDTHQDNTEGEVDDSSMEIERKLERVKTAATKRKLYSTAYSEKPRSKNTWIMKNSYWLRWSH